MELNRLLEKFNDDLKATFNSMDDSIIIFQIDDDGSFKDILEANDEACRRFGCSKEDLFRLFSSYINCEDKKDIIRKLMESGSASFEITHISDEGIEVPYEVYCNLMELYEKKVVICEARDITKRKNIEDHLKNAHFVLEQIFNNTGDGMCIIDKDYNIVKINDRLLNLLELKKDEVVNKKCYEILKGFACNSEICSIRRVMSGENYFVYEAKKGPANKKIPFLITTTPLKIDDKEIVGAIQNYKDISFIKEKEMELMEAKKRAEEASKMKTQFLANISHEIRTPMNGIVGIAELLKDTPLTHEQQEYVDMLVYSTERLLSIINAVLDISKIESGRLELTEDKFSLYTLLDKLVNYFKLQAQRKGLEFHHSIEPQIPDILFGDSGKLNQILFNLLGNAVKFTECGFIEFNVMLAAKYDNGVVIQFSVKDTGIGIPEEKIDYVFENFTQLDPSNNRKYGGTGLGLSISKKLVELMGGSIHLNSHKGKGSTFTFSVVLKTAPSESINVQASYDDSIELEAEHVLPLNILAAEDDIINQKIIKHLLERAGHKATLVSNGKEVLEKIKTEAFDLILMDIHMPELNGCDTSRIIRKQELETGRYTPIIALTASAINEGREICYRSGVNYYLTKPVRSEDLYNAISYCLKKKEKEVPLALNPLIDKLDGNIDLINSIIDEVTSEKYEEENLCAIEIYLKEKNLKS